MTYSAWAMRCHCTRLSIVCAVGVPINSVLRPPQLAPVTHKSVSLQSDGGPLQRGLVWLTVDAHGIESLVA